MRTAGTHSPVALARSQLARGRGVVVDTGYANLSAKLLGGGWPVGALVEMLLQQPGSGEVRLPAPALAKLKSPIALIQPPAEPVTYGWSHAGIARPHSSAARKTYKRSVVGC